MENNTKFLLMPKRFPHKLPSGGHKDLPHWHTEKSEKRG